MNPIIEKIRQELKSIADPVAAESSKRFFKEDQLIKVYGIKTPIVIKIAKEHLKKLSNEPKGTIYSLCEELWKSGIIEEVCIACEWAYAQRKLFSEDDFAVFDRWVKNYVTNWAACDTLCNHTIGTFVEMYPSYLNELKKWTKSDNRWVKRAAAVTLIIPGKKGIFADDIFDIATLLMTDTDDMVQKGYGWLLKATSGTYPQRVFDFVNSHKATMPRTALRYAIEKLPAEMKREAMQKD